MFILCWMWHLILKYGFPISLMRITNTTILSLKRYVIFFFISSFCFFVFVYFFMFVCLFLYVCFFLFLKLASLVPIENSFMLSKLSNLCRKFQLEDLRKSIFRSYATKFLPYDRKKQKNKKKKDRKKDKHRHEKTERCV